MSCLNRFKGWCQENFPFIEDDFNAITDYQLMCKLKEYVVSIGNDVANLEIDYNELAGKIVELEEIVNNMDGEFDDLVEEFNSLKTLVESYNMRIQANANRIEQVNTNLQQLISLNINELKNYVDREDTLILAEISTINNNIVLIRKDIEVIAEGIPKVRDTGTIITLNDTIKDAPIDMKLDPSELEQVTTTGANLQKFNVRSATIAGAVSYNCSDNGQITLSGTASSTSQTAINQSGNEISLEAGTYVIKLIGTLGNVNTIYMNINGTLQGGQTLDSNNEMTFTLTETSNVRTLIGISNRTTYSSDFYITLAKTTATTERYTGGIAQPNPTYPSDVHVITGDNEIVVSNSDNTLSQVKPLTLGDIEYCKIGNYQDNFFKAIDGDSIYDTLDSTTKASLTSGKWYMFKRLPYKIFNGSETGWVRSGISVSEKYRMTYTGIAENCVKPSSSAIAAQMICNYFKVVDNNSTYTGIQGVSMRSSNGYVDFYSDAYNTDLNSFLEWLSTHNTKLYYVLETPEYILLNDTLQQQLDDIYETLKAYNDQTNITQINHDLPFIITAITMKKGSVTDEM